MNTPDRNSKPANSRTVLVLDDDVLVRMPVVNSFATAAIVSLKRPVRTRPL
jgi:hypothetical protein